MNRVTEALDIVVRVAALGDYDSNVIGMAAEIIAEDIFGMTKASRGKKDIDGLWKTGEETRTVQVKAWSEARVKKYRAGTFLRVKEVSASDDLLVLLIYCSKPDYAVLYHGPTKAVGYIEPSGASRAIRFDTMKTRDEVQQILNTLS